MTSLLAPPAKESSDPAEVTISIVIAAYQAEHTLTAAVESALAQSPHPKEVIVVDDRSTDATAAVAESFGDRVRLIRRPHSGEAATKNAGALASRATHVAYLDADDVMLPGWLDAICSAFTQRPDLDLVTADAWLVQDGRRVRRVYEGGFRFTVENQRHELLRRNFVLGLCAVRRDRLLATGGFDERVSVASDWSAWLRLVLEGGLLACVPEPLAEYRLHSASLSADTTRLLQGRVEVLQRCGDYPGLAPDDRAVLASSLADQRRLLQVARARTALLAGSPGVRRLCLTVARDRSLPAISRVKALAAAALPLVLSRRLLVRSDGGGFRGGATSDRTG